MAISTQDALEYLQSGGSASIVGAYLGGPVGALIFGAGGVGLQAGSDYLEELYGDDSRFSGETIENIQAALDTLDAERRRKVADEAASRAMDAARQQGVAAGLTGEELERVVRTAGEAVRSAFTGQVSDLTSDAAWQGFAERAGLLVGIERGGAADAMATKPNWWPTLIIIVAAVIAAYVIRQQRGGKRRKRRR